MKQTYFSMRKIHFYCDWKRLDKLIYINRTVIGRCTPKTRVSQKLRSHIDGNILKQIRSAWKRLDKFIYINSTVTGRCTPKTGVPQKLRSHIDGNIMKQTYKFSIPARAKRGNSIQRKADNSLYQG